LSDTPPDGPEPAAPTPALPGFDTLESRPRFLERGRWVSFDRQHWWNGSGWVFGQPPGLDPKSPSRQVSGDPSLAQLGLGLAGLIAFGAVAFAMWQAMQTGQP